MSEAPQPSYLPGNVLAVLGRLASEPYQLRWIVNATASEYVLPDDLVNDVHAVARWAAAANTMPKILATVHRFLAEFYECVGLLPDDIDVQRDAAWLRIREAAARTLRQLGHEIPDDVP